MADQTKPGRKLMNTPDLITAIDAEIDRLTRVRKLLLTGASIETRGRKRKLSAAARARISATQKKEMGAAEKSGQGMMPRYWK